MEEAEKVTVESEPSLEELEAKAQQLRQQESVKKREVFGKELEALLNKYGYDLQVTHQIAVVPRATS
jgi:hypothetical protein